MNAEPGARASAGDMTPQERPPEPADILRRLRRSYPEWAFIYDERTSTWTACRGKTEVITKTNAVALRCAVDSAR